MDYLTLDFKRRRLKKIINIAGPRYTPKLNVELPIATIFEGECRTPAFFDRIKENYGKTRRHYSSIGSKQAIAVAKDQYKEIDKLLKSTWNILARVDSSLSKPINWKKVKNNCEKLRDSIWKYTDALRDADEKNKKEEKSTNPREEGFSSTIHYLYELNNELYKLSNFASSHEALLSNNPRLLLTGIAGSGKTHLFCDIAKSRLKDGFSTYIFLGEEFTVKDPWQQILAVLNSAESPEKLLERINRDAVRRKKKVLIMVDGINESLVKVNWAKLNLVKKYSHISLALSVRSGFEKILFTDRQRNSFVNVVHNGYESKEWEAIVTYFKDSKIRLPEYPLLLPEFQNPLFLKIFCKTHKGDKSIKGHASATGLFEDYVIKQGNEVLKKLSLPKGRVNGEHKIWDELFKEGFAKNMADGATDRIIEREAFNIVETVFPGKSKQVLALLQRYWLVTRVPHYTNRGKVYGYEYRFPYQKFSDHLITRYLLEKFLDKNNPRKSFLTSKKLGQIIMSGNLGLIEAISVEVPERLKGTELVSIAPKKFCTTETARDAFLSSLIWRDTSLKNGKPKAFNTKLALKYINKYVIRTEYGHTNLLNTLLTVSVIPNHPFNALLLHRHLQRFKMPERDSWWLQYLHHNFGYKDAIDRILTWAWEYGNKQVISNETAELAGITLGWFLASPNRFLRDSATKALINFLTDKVEVIIVLLKRFKSVDDPYIQERLYAVACGCALRTSQKNQLKKLAMYVYMEIFEKGKPPIHILLRDYARGTIEAAMYRTKGLKIDITKTKPPFSSQWPDKVATEKALKKKYYPDDFSKIGRNNRGYLDIWSSLMYNFGSLGDFGNYVANSNLGRFSSRRLNEPNRPSQRELYDEFVASLGKKQQDIWKKLEELNSNLMMKSIFESIKKDEGKENIIDNSKIDQAKKALVSEFRKSLTDDQRKIYVSVVLPYWRNGKFTEIPGFNTGLAQRWMFKRVIELGWSPKLHGDYDNSTIDRNRDSHKSERIGKKYQWIALHECLARVADNFKLLKDRWLGKIDSYEGPWQLSVRDIDPSHVLKKTEEAKVKSWWSNASYTDWKLNQPKENWLKCKDDTPNIKKIIQSSKASNIEWLLLEGFIHWEQNFPPDEEKYEKQRREFWFMVKGYLVKKDKVEEFYKWAIEQDFWDRWMPESHEFYDIFLREYPWSTAFSSINDPYYGRSGWTNEVRRGKNLLPTDVLVVNDEYMQEGNSYDCSTETGFHIKLPAKFIYDAMSLRQNKDGTFLDSKGDVVICDPAVFEAGPSVLIARKDKFREFLKKNDLNIVWTVLGEKRLIGGNREDWIGQQKINGSYYLKNGNLRGKVRKDYFKYQR